MNKNKIFSICIITLLFSFLIACSSKPTLSNNDETNSILKSIKIQDNPTSSESVKVNKTGQKICKILQKNEKNLKKLIGFNIETAKSKATQILNQSAIDCELSFNGSSDHSVEVFFIRTKNVSKTFETLSQRLDPESNGRINSKTTTGFDNLTSFRIRKFANGIVVVRYRSTNSSDENRYAISGAIMNYFI